MTRLIRNARLHAARPDACGSTSSRTFPTMNRFFLQAVIGLAALGFAWLPIGFARADDGHDHGDSTPAASGPALPRFDAVSDGFELVGVLDGRRLTLYLDRAADNAPVTDARIELEIAGAQVDVEKHGDEDTFGATLAAAPAPGVLPVTATITAGDEVDLLAGELDLHGTAEAPPRAAHRPAGWIAAAAAVALALVALVVVRRRRASAVTRGRA